MSEMEHGLEAHATTMERLEQLLKQADQRQPGESDPAELADRVLKTIRRRRITRTVTAVLLVGGVVGMTLMNLPHSTPTREIADLPKPPLARRVEDELAQIKQEIALREATLGRLEAIEHQSALASRLATVPATAPEDQIIERAAAVVVFQADRMLSEGDDPQSAARAYHEVIAYFPQAISARTARQRVAQFDKAG